MHLFFFPSKTGRAEEGNAGGEPSSANTCKRLEGECVVLANKVQEALIVEAPLNKNKELALQLRVGHLNYILNKSATQTVVIPTRVIVGLWQGILSICANWVG